MFNPHKKSSPKLPLTSPVESSLPDLYWYEYQATEADPARARPLKFTGMKTALDLTPLGAPISLLCKLSPDILPDPVHCASTKLTPTDTYLHGLSEPEFADAINRELCHPNLCAIGVGPAFADEELTRHLMYRNFRPIYCRDYQPCNSRFNFQGFLSLTRALFPSTLIWGSAVAPSTTLSLFDLAVANGFSHPHPSGATSPPNLLAAQFLLKLIEIKLPEFFTEMFALRQPAHLKQTIDHCLSASEPVLLADSSMSDSKFSLLLPWFFLGEDHNLLVVIDQIADCTKCLGVSPEAITASFRHHTFFHDFPEIRIINLNRSPILLPVRWVVHHQTEHLPVDWLSVFQHTQKVASCPAVKQAMETAFAQNFVHDFSQSSPHVDPELRLYEKFPEPFLARQLSLVAQTSPAELANIKFGEPKYDALLFRYRARNFYCSLNTAEKQLWLDFCRHRLGADALAATPISWEHCQRELTINSHQLCKSLADKLSLWLEYSRKVFAAPVGKPSTD